MRFSKALVYFVLVAAFGLEANSQTIQINRDNKTIAISTTDEATTVADIAAITLASKYSVPIPRALMRMQASFHKLF